MSLLGKIIQGVGNGIAGFLGKANPDSRIATDWEMNHGRDFRPLEEPEVMLQIPWVAACIRVISNTIKKTDLRVYPKTGSGNDSYIFNPRNVPQGSLPKPVTNSPLQKLLNKPNPYMTGRTLLEGTTTWLEAYGNAYWILDEMDYKGRPKYIWLADPRHMRPVPHKTDFISGYIHEVAGEEIHFEKDEVIHFKYFNPFDPWLGLGTVQTLASLLETEVYREIFDKNFFKNGARISGVLETDKPIDDRIFKRVARQWRQMHEGAKNSHRTAILEAGLRYRPMMHSYVEMDKLAGDKYNREKILAVFGVPPSKLGIMENANFSNSADQDKTFLSETIQPKLAYLEEEINNHLASRYDNVEVRFDNVITIDEDALTRRVQTIALSGLLTINELRGMLGYPPRPDGERLTVPPGAPSPSDFSGGDGRPKDEGLNKSLIDEVYAPEPNRGSFIDGKKADLEKLVNDRLIYLSTIRNEFEADFNKFFSDQEDRIVRQMFRRGKSGRSYNFKPEDLWDEEEENNLLEEILMLLIITSGKEGFTRANELLDGDLEWDIKDAVLIKIIEQLVARGLLANETTRDQVIKVVQEGMRRGYSVRQIAEGYPDENYGGIASIFEKARSYRGDRIIRDISVDAYNLSALAAYESLGLKQVFVTDGVDYDEACRLANGSIWSINKAVKNPKEHIGCRRAFWPIIRKEDNNV